MQQSYKNLVSLASNHLMDISDDSEDSLQHGDSLLAEGGQKPPRVNGRIQKVNVKRPASRISARSVDDALKDFEASFGLTSKTSELERNNLR